MKKLSDFKGADGIVAAAKIVGIFADMMHDAELMAIMRKRAKENPVVLFSTLVERRPTDMKNVFAILEGKEPKDYFCSGEEALANILAMAQDHALLGLFISPSRTGEAKSSGSAQENTEA